MADVIYPVTGRSINVRYADQNDGTHAEVVRVIGGGTNGTTPVVAVASDPIGTGTREYNFAAATRTAIGSTSSAAVAIGTLGTSREVMLVASSRCMIKWGTSGVTAAAATDTDVLVLPADAMFHLRIPAGVTHFRVIRDTADGFLRVTPVA